MDAEDLIPEQETGLQTNTESSVDCKDEDSALYLYGIARQRLLDVNNWHKLAGKATADFRLVDAANNHVNRPAQKGDYFRIDIPGPGTQAGGGDDWVQIEAIDETEDIIALRVRPSAPPQSSGDVAHFFTDQSTSSFMVRREKDRVIAGVYGRNEKPNTEVSSITDRIRNAAVAIGAFFGLSKLQWKSLTDGLLGVKS
jgi:hypothetical protein